MRKAWMYKRKGIRNWWVGWYESGKRKAKALPTKALTEHYRQVNYHALTDVVLRRKNKVYTNVDPVLRHAVEQIPVGDWL
jgi:hypothetical protein